jgi:small multidrug resistance pump
MALKTMSVGSTYAIWSGLGIVLVTIVAWVFYQQIPDLLAIIGMILIILGVIIMNVFSKTVSH